jgi:alkylation response protein AidB-like acyl-CoA dehydrogenase
VEKRPRSLLSVCHDGLEGRSCIILTETQIQIRDTARDFARDERASTAALRDKLHAFPKTEMAELGQLGFLGMRVPEIHGGSDVDAVTYAAVLEEIAAGDGACSTIVSVHSSVCCAPILRFGTEEQKRRFLPKLASGEWIGGFALTEPQAGSDASNLRARARLGGDHYILSGTKQFITSGKNGQVMIVFAVSRQARHLARIVSEASTAKLSAPKWRSGYARPRSRSMEATAILPFCPLSASIVTFGCARSTRERVTSNAW